jgi:hypothetical protein
MLPVLWHAVNRLAVRIVVSSPHFDGSASVPFLSPIYDGSRSDVFVVRNVLMTVCKSSVSFFLELPNQSF